MLQATICAFLAPALVSAYAFPWAGPEPTLVIPEQDNWSPAPTDGPVLGELELFRRADDNTCGYISGDASQSLTCNNANYVCATNTYYGVHGCCDPNGISTCSIPTTCIESTRLSASCTGDCSSNDYIAKCTDASAPFCYQWRYDYGSTVMTEFGCADSAFTTSVLRTISGASSRLPSDASVSEEITSSSSSSTTSSSATSSNTAPPQESGGGKKSTNVGAIVGGVVGGLVVIGALVFGIVFVVLRNKKQKQNAANAASGATQPFMSPAPGVTEYKPQTGSYNPQQQYPAGGEAAGYFNNGQEQNKAAWQQSQYGSPPTSPAPQYPGIAHMQPMVPAGVAEAGGTPVPGHPPNPQNPNVYEAPDTSRQT